MRIGIDAANLRWGGVTHLAELLRAADPLALGIRKVIVWGGRALLDQLDEAPWLERVHEPPLDGPLGRRVLWQRQTLDRRAFNTCDLLFVPGGSYAGRFRPFVTMSQNLLPFDAPERRRYGRSWMSLKLGLLERIQTSTFRRADGVIFLNEYARRSVEAVTGPLPGRVAVIPHGVNPAFQAAPRPQEGFERFGADRPFRLLYVSTVDVYKHQWHLVDACARLRARGVPVTLDLVGSAYGPALTRLKAAMASADPEGRFVRYSGAVTHAALPARYKAADGFAFASSCESMPNVLLEAMAAGLPIACAKRGPMPLVLGDAGVYFDPEVPESISVALERMVRDPGLRATLATAAHRRALAHTWERCCSETLDLFSRVVGHRSATPGPEPAVRA